MLSHLDEQYYKKIRSNLNDIGNDMYTLMERLYPIHRCITGEGIRQSLKIISEYIPIKIENIPTNTKVFDWTIPEEWNINDAYIMKSNGEKIVDIKKSNLHILQYSTSINKKIGFDELKEHIFTNKDQPDAIPYLTSYYNKNWGFCMEHNKFLKMSKEEYFVKIDSEHKNGSLTYGEFLIKGETDEEILISTYVCHPSICNDNLSGVVLSTLLAKILSDCNLHYSVRFLFIPETIGSIAWLYFNQDKVQKIKHGLVATCLGDSGISTYKKSRDGNSVIDKVVEQVLQESGEPFKILDFWPSGGADERQFSSPGFNIPVGSLMRTVYGTYGEYHTSADNLNFVNKESLANSFSKYFTVIHHLDNLEWTEIKRDQQSKKISKNNDPVFINLYPKCEPQLGKRGLYHIIGGITNQGKSYQKGGAFSWVLNFSDGFNSISDIEKRAKSSIEDELDFETLLEAANILKEKKLLVENISN